MRPERVGCKNEKNLVIILDYKFCVFFGWIFGFWKGVLFMWIQDIPIKNRYVLMVETTRTSGNFEIQEFRIPTLEKSRDGPGSYILQVRFLWTILWTSSILLFDKVPILGFLVSEQLKNENWRKMISGIEFRPLEIPDEEWYGPNGLRKQFITMRNSQLRHNLGWVFFQNKRIQMKPKNLGQSLGKEWVESGKISIKKLWNYMNRAINLRKQARALAENYI